MSVDFVDSKLKRLDSLMEYFDTSGNLENLKQQCNRFLQSKTTLVYTFRVLVDPAVLIEIDAELGNALLNTPNDVLALIRELVYQIVNVLEWLPSDVTLPQISVIVRLSCLPSLCHRTIRNSTDLSRLSAQHGFVRISGIVIGVTATSKYTQSTRYRCSDEDCEGHHGNHFIRVHISGASEAQTIRNDFTCIFCWKHLEEEKKCRFLSEKIVAELVTKSAFSSERPDSYRIQAVPVYLRDDLTQNIELGGHYTVIGLIRKDIKGENIMLALEANNVEKINPVAFQKDIPKTIQNMYEDRKSSPWSFVLSLAYFFADDITPPGTFLRLKMCILLSLVTQSAETISPLHLLAVGQDTNILHKLLMYGQKYTSRSHVHSSSGHVTGKVTCDKYESAPYFIEGGSFHLSKNGVCYLGDINRYKKSVKEQIQTALGQKKCSIGISSKFTGGLPQQLEETLSCHVWAYSDPAPSRGFKNDPFQGQDTSDSSARLQECFSLIHYTNIGPFNVQEEVNLHCTHQELLLAMGNNHKPVITEEEFSVFLKYASSIDPVMGKECESLIHGYYLSCRKARSLEGNSKVPVSALQTLYSIAAGHARLSLRSDVSVEDGLMAIWIYEESLTSRLGHSILSVQPCPHVPADDIQQYLVKQNDAMMRQFHVNLLRFCTSQASWEE